MLFSIYTMWTQLCIYAYLCEYCMVGRWPLCTIHFWIWICCEWIKQSLNSFIGSIYIHMIAYYFYWALLVKFWNGSSRLQLTKSDTIAPYYCFISINTNRNVLTAQNSIVHTHTHTQLLICQGLFTFNLLFQLYVVSPFISTLVLTQQSNKKRLHITQTIWYIANNQIGNTYDTPYMPG